MKLLLCILNLWIFVACGNNTVFDLSNQKKTLPGVSYNNKIDVLWVIDSSGTMSDKREKLASHISYMFQVLDSKKLDYRMAAVTLDMSDRGDPNYRNGKFVGSPKVITPQTSNKSSAFSQMLNVPESETSIEKGRLAVRTALSPAMLSSVNSGFFREEALLVLIFVSDEDDGTNEPVQYDIDFLNQLKPKISDTRLGWMANFVGVLESSSSCRTSGGISNVGFDYIELVNVSGGSLSSVCEGDLSAAVDNLQRRLVSIVTSIPLSAKPVLETIVVKFDGKIMPQSSENGWTYDEPTNSIVFHGSAIPASDVVIDVVYKPSSLDD